MYGMESVSGEMDVDMNMEIEQHSDTQTVYGIGRIEDEDDGDPLYLIIDNDLSDNELMLGYIPDNDGDDDLPDVPTEPKKEKKYVGL